MEDIGSRLLTVPVRIGPRGAVTLRTARLEDGSRVGVAFTSPAALAAVYGAGQPSVRLCGRVVGELLGEVGIGALRIDPVRVPVSRPEAALPPAAVPAARRPHGRRSRRVVRHAV